MGAWTAVGDTRKVIAVAGDGGFAQYLAELEAAYGLAEGFLTAAATQESGCRWCPSPLDNCSTGNSANAKGMFQFVYPESWGISNPYDPYD